MAIQTSFTIKQVNVDQALQEAEAKAKKTANNIDNSLNKSSGTANKMTNTLKSGLQGASKLGAKLGGTLKNALGGIMSGGIWGAVISGIVIGIQKIYEMWQNMTLSMEQSIQLTKDQLAAAERETARVQSDINKYEPYIKALRELNGLENKTASTYTQMITLIQMLQQRYGDLGVKINKTTGEVTGLDQALKRLRDRQHDETVSAKKRQMDLARDQAYKTAYDADYKTYMKGQKQNKYTGHTYGGTKTVRFNKISLQELDRDLERSAKAPQRYKKIKAVRDAYERYLTKQKAYTDVKDLRPWINDNIPLAMQFNSRQKRNKELKKQYAIAQRQKAMSEVAGHGPDRQQWILRLRRSHERDEISRVNRNIQNWEVKAYNTQQDIKPLREKQKNGTLTVNQSKELVRLEGQLLKYQIEIQKHKEKELTHRTAEIKLTQQIEEIERQRQQYVQDMEKSDEDAAKVLELQIKGKYDQAAQLQLINDLKRRGIQLDKKQLVEVEKRKNALKTLQIKSAFGDNLYNMLYSRMPNKKEAEFEKRKRDMQRRYGTELTDKEKSTLKQIIDLEFTDIPKPDFSQLDIKTNDLTARGGFQTGAVMQNANTINRQIRDYSAKQNAVLQQIRQLIKDGGYI